MLLETNNRHKWKHNYTINLKHELAKDITEAKQIHASLDINDSEYLF